jgi:DinB superfamily
MTAVKTDRLDLGDVVAVLARTPASLTALLEGLPATWVRATEGDQTWSPYDVVGHLIHGERTDWMVRVRHILAGEARSFDSFDRKAQFRLSQGATLTDLLATFARLRKHNVDELVSMKLTNADLNRTGEHPELGEVTLGQLLATWVVHDLDHVVQIARTMAKVYAEDVGPWSAYLSILQDREAKGSSNR